MNKKVLRTMITLVIVFLVSLYVLKIFFPQEFVMAIQNEQFIKLGNFIDQRKWLTLVANGITSFIVMYLYLCATTKRWKLKLKEICFVLVLIVATRLISLWDFDIANGIMTISMFIFPALMGASLKTTCNVYCTHYVAQLLSLKIRSLPLLLTNINSIIAIFMTFECYLWLLLFYVYNNYKEIK